MDVNTNIAQRPGYTILRIKRKRDEDVPEVLVVEPSPKKGSKRRRSGGIDVFQFAESVDAAAWKDMEHDALRDRISELAKATPEGQLGAQSEAKSTTLDAISRHSSSQTHTRQYRVIAQDEREHGTRLSRFATAPPKVLSSKDLEQSASNIRIYDAVLAQPGSEVEVDPEMGKFQSLLQDYLTVNDGIQTQFGQSTRSTSAVSARPTPSSSNDYVYDIFYHRPSTKSEWTTVASMATVTGLPSEFDEDYDLDSDSEEEDEADEDSNAEDFYKNEYPDEESSEDGGSDMFHDYSEDERDEGRFKPDG